MLAAGRKPGESLNLKTEWSGAKIPGLLVSNPNEMAKEGRKYGKEETSQNLSAREKNYKAAKRGNKILNYRR